MTNLTLPVSNIKESPSFIRQDTSEKIWNILTDMEADLIRPAPHQRGDNAWDLKRKRAWIDRLWRVYREGVQPPLGGICIYYLRDNGNIGYLNEGYQRISACWESKRHPEMYGFAGTEIQELLRANTIHVQCRTYEAHHDAVDDFCAVNNGVTLVPEEKNRHILVYAENWATTWSPLMDHWKNEIDNILSSYCKKNDKRRQSLSRLRSAYHLFCVAHTGMPLSYGIDETLEKATVACFYKSNPEIVRTYLKTIKDFSAEIESCWRLLHPRAGDMMLDSLARWLIGVFMQNQDNTTPKWRKEFLIKIIESTGGTANCSYKNAEGKQITEFLNKNLGVFHKICSSLGIQPPGIRDGVKHPKILNPGSRKTTNYHFAILEMARQSRCQLALTRPKMHDLNHAPFI